MPDQQSIKLTMMLDLYYDKVLKNLYDYDWVTHNRTPPAVPHETYLMFQIDGQETTYARKSRMISQLRRTCMACSMCELGLVPAEKGGIQRDPHVLSNQNPTRFMVIGQNPGWNELEKCEPFVGQAGQKFDTAIAKYGLSRDDFYICNTVRCYTEGNTTPEHRNVERCRPFLQMEINLIRPLIVVTLGKVAFECLCPQAKYGDSLGKLVKSTVFDVNVYAVYHPSPLNMANASRAAAFDHQIKILCEVIKKLKERHPDWK